MTHDAVIIGGGPAGAAAAIALAQAGRRVAVVERADFPRRKVCGEFMSATNLELLDWLGVGDEVRSRSGPEVRRIAFYGSQGETISAMPRGNLPGFGRALGRDVLDDLLLSAARRAGADVFQPWRAVEIAGEEDGSIIRITNRDEEGLLHAPVVVAAHGSWEVGRLPSNLEKTNRPGDLLGFKAHFRGGALAPDLMPLFVFPGGYGGMVWADQGRLSLSCCIRRDTLAALRRATADASAASAVFAHILGSCPAVRRAVAGATLAGEWLAAGPIRPGLRPGYEHDIFRVGNLAGESHPIIAEGISMALQSGWMLAAELLRSEEWTLAARRAAGARYGNAWRRQFSMRILTASALAGLAMRPVTADLMRRTVQAFPTALIWGAQLSGKTKALPRGGAILTPGAQR